MRPLVMNNEIRSRIAKIVEYAFENRVTLDNMIARVNDPKKRYKPLGDDTMRTLEVPMGYMITFTVEEQKPPIGWCRHISVSIDLKDVGTPLPSLYAVQMLMAEFGFSPLNQNRDHVYIETISGGEMDGKKAVNILQQITPAAPGVEVKLSPKPSNPAT